MLKNRGLSLVKALFAFLLFLLLILVVYLLTNKPTAKTATTKTTSPTINSNSDDLKAYSNSKYSLAFKYPSNWSIRTTNQTDGEDINLSPITSANLSVNIDYVLKQPRPFAANTNPVLGDILINNKPYSLIGNQPDAISVVSVFTCINGNNCNNQIATTKGGYITANISSNSTMEGTPTSTPLNIGGSQYKTALIILESLRF